MAGWMVGPLAATAALVVIGFVFLGLYTSGGGLLIAGMIAFWTGAGAAAWADRNRQGRNAVIVAVYVVLLFAAWLFILQSQSPPPGALYGGPNVAEAGQTSARAGLRGVWKVTELSSRASGEDWVSAAPSSSVYIFTDKHYSYMYAIGAAPRRLFAGDPNRPTDAEKVGAYNSFVAASGTYVLSGATLTLNAALHKNPNEMTGEPLSYTVEIDGNTLRMTIVNPPFAPGRERRTVLTRVE